jgi:hypothetical protein
MKYNLFLDDFRMPEDAFEITHIPVYITIDDWITVRNYDEFIKTIQEKGIPDIVSFDHDLADVHYNNQVNVPYDEYTEKTGYHCAKWLIDYCIDNNKELPATILIHSMNPAGSLNIKSLFESYLKSLNL